MQNFVELLRGKKTYFMAAIGLLYLGGCGLEFWEFNEGVLAGIGFGGLATLRSALKGNDQKSQGKGNGSAVLVAALLVGASGCGTLDPAGVYKGDALLYRADLMTTTAYDTLHGFVKWEYENEEALAQWPAIGRAAARVRGSARAWIGSAIALREAYATTPSAENRKALEQALQVLRTALVEATKYMTTYDSTSNN